MAKVAFFQCSFKLKVTSEKQITLQMSVKHLAISDFLAALNTKSCKLSCNRAGVAHSARQTPTAGSKMLPISSSWVFELINLIYELDGCIMWNAHNTIFGSIARISVHKLFTSCIQRGLVLRDSIFDWLPATEFELLKKLLVIKDIRIRSRLRPFLLFMHSTKVNKIAIFAVLK